MGWAPVTFTNWAGNYSCTPAVLASPGSESEVQAYVRDAVAAGQGVRVVGAGHSFSPIHLTEGTLIRLDNLRGVLAVDTARGRARVKAGTRIAELGEPLWDAGLSLRNQGDIDAQAISGAIGTATHGSGIEYQSLSMAMKGCRIVTASGEVLVVDESTPELLRAAQVAIGMLGVMTEVELSLSPAYRLRERIERWTWEETVGAWEQNVRSHRHFSFFWLPFDESAALYGIPVPEGTTGAGTCYVKIYDDVAAGEPDDDTPDRRVDRAYRIYPMPDFEPNFYEFEYYVPFERSVDALAEMREFMLARYPASLFPLEVRTTAADDAYLSPFYESDMTVFSISGIPGTDYEPYLRAAHELLGRYSARVHWGKLHFLTRDELDARLPGAEAFRRIRRELDPKGTFLNESLRPLFE